MLIEVIEKDKYLHCLVTGEYVMENAVELIPQIILRCGISSKTKVMVDHRNLQGSPAAVERFIFAEEMLNIYDRHLAKNGPAIRVVFLASENCQLTYNPGLEQAVSRGLSTTVLTDFDEALNWLLPELATVATT